MEVINIIKVVIILVVIVHSFHFFITIGLKVAIGWIVIIEVIRGCVIIFIYFLKLNIGMNFKLNKINRK